MVKTHEFWVSVESFQISDWNNKKLAVFFPFKTFCHLISTHSLVFTLKQITLPGDENKHKTLIFKVKEVTLNTYRGVLNITM